jgi:hypothetical protein
LLSKAPALPHDEIMLASLAEREGFKLNNNQTPEIDL